MKPLLWGFLNPLKDIPVPPIYDAKPAVYDYLRAAGVEDDVLLTLEGYLRRAYEAEFLTSAGAKYIRRTNIEIRLLTYIVAALIIAVFCYLVFWA